MIFAPVCRLEFEQLLPLTLSEAWDFFSRPENLAKITPENLAFEVTSPLPERMYAGMIVNYRVRPLAGIAVPWTTEITHVVEPVFFVDEQRSGPYRLWLASLHPCRAANVTRRNLDLTRGGNRRILAITATTAGASNTKLPSDRVGEATPTRLDRL